ESGLTHRPAARFGLLDMSAHILLGPRVSLLGHRPGGGHVPDFEPTTIIAQMLGVPVADRPRFQRWSQALLAPGAARGGALRAVPHVWRFLRYVRKLIRARRALPQDDLVSALVQAEEAGRQLSEDELVAMIVLLLIAGHETTVNLIGNGTLALLRHPEQLQ